jgi:hypothetical protein
VDVKKKLESFGKLKMESKGEVGGRKEEECRIQDPASDSNYSSSPRIIRICRVLQGWRVIGDLLSAPASLS